MSLKGRVAIVTGGARGLGASTAEALAGEGATVVLADVLEDVGRGTAEQIAAQGLAAEFAFLDVTDPQNWSGLVDSVLQRHGSIDILVNNAGISISGSIEDITLERLRRVFDVNFVGPFLGIKAVLPAMKASGNGAIVNIASNTSQFILGQATAYGASKAALANLTKTAAAHCARSGYGIRVNSIHPGPHATDMIISQKEGVGSKALAGFTRAIPMGRLGDPSDVAAAVVFLASDAARYITGTELFVDGGLTMSPFG